MNQISLHTRLAVAIVFGLGLFVGTTDTFAQSISNWINNNRSHTDIASRDSNAMRRLLRPLAESIESSVVQVFSGSRLVALGTVVSEDGYILTKRSELNGDPISVRLPNGEKVNARVAEQRRANDIALLKLESGDESSWEIRPAKFETQEPLTGSFLVSFGRDGITIGVGVLGVPARHIGHQGRLGVNFYETPSGPATVRRVYPASGADQAGVQGGDRIVKINGSQTLGSQSAITTLGRMYPGDVVRLTILRGDNTIEIDAQMSDQRLLLETKDDAKVNGPRNVRLSGFDSVIQHDTVLAPNQCGGPIVDSQGNVVGINIARAGRVVSYALPSSLINAELIGMLERARSN